MVKRYKSQNYWQTAKAASQSQCQHIDFWISSVKVAVIINAVLLMDRGGWLKQANIACISQHRLRAFHLLSTWPFGHLGSRRVATVFLTLAKNYKGV